MKKENKVIKLNQEEIESILSEYLNGSKDRYVSTQVYATKMCLFGKIDENLRLVCVLSNDKEEEDIFKLDLTEIDKSYNFTADKAVDLKNKN